VYYYPDDFRWPECPVSALTAPRDALSVDPVEVVRYLGEIRVVGGKAALFRQTRNDARMFDAALVIEAARASEAAARMEAVTKR
jgi:hypothetical protein